MRRAEITAVALLVVAACGGAEQNARPQERTPRRIELEEISMNGCPSFDEGAPANVEALPDSIVPEAVGQWIRQCDPESPGPHQPRGYEAFVYDGRYLSLVAVSRTPFEDPTLAVDNSQRVFRLESEWRDDVLFIRVPSFLRFDSDEQSGSEWLAVARFDAEQGVFLWPESDEVAYVRGPHLMQVGPWRRLTEPHAPLADPEAATDTLAARVFAHLSGFVTTCVDALDQPTDVSGHLAVEVAPDGRITAMDGAFESEHRTYMRRCAREQAAAHPRIEGYEAASPGRYQMHFRTH